MRTAYPIVTLGRFARCSIVSCGNPLIYRLSGLWMVYWLAAALCGRGLCVPYVYTSVWPEKGALTLVAVGRARGGLPVA